MNTASRLVGVGLLLLATQLVTCDSFNSFNSPCKGRWEDLEPIEGTVLFEVKEGYETLDTYCEPAIFLRMQTQKIYGCCNFTIESAVWRFGENISVALLGIYKPSICLTALGPATAVSALKLRPGEYTLRFLLADSVDMYRLTVTDEAISITDPDTSFTRPQTWLNWRYPPRSCAYLCGTMTETSWICSDFLDSLLATGRFEEFQFPDSGEIPYPRQSMGHYYDMPAMYFRYTAEADFDSAGVVLERYTHSVISQYSGVGLSMVNWKNKWYRSWMFED